jgi:hypothetical protein
MTSLRVRKAALRKDLRSMRGFAFYSPLVMTLQTRGADGRGELGRKQVLRPYMIVRGE